MGSFAEWQLGRPSTPHPELARLVRTATGHDIDSLDRILEGYSNEVYRVGCVSGDDVVIRILRFDDDVSMSRSAAEAWAIEKARSAGVPTGEVLLLDTVRVEDMEYPVMVQRAVPGRPLSDRIGGLTLDQRHAVLHEVGQLLGRLNAITVDRPGVWATAMAADLRAQRAQRADQALIVDAGFTVTQARGMFELLDRYLRESAHQPTVLNHGDLSTKHIFLIVDPASRAHVSGFIDFGDWTPGAPVHDLAVLRVRSPELELKPILAGYRQSAAGTTRRELDLHTLFIALGALRFQMAELDHAGAAVTADLIHALVGDIGER